MALSRGVIAGIVKSEKTMLNKTPWDMVTTDHDRSRHSTTHCDAYPVTHRTIGNQGT